MSSISTMIHIKVDHVLHRSPQSLLASILGRTMRECCHWAKVSHCRFEGPSHADRSCRRFTLLHLGDIDSAIPSPLPDSEMGLIGVAEPRESEMTSLVFRIRIAQHGEQVANEVYGCARCAPVVVPDY